MSGAMIAAACLDADGGRIVGYALGAPARITLALDGVPARQVLAVCPFETLPDAALTAIGPPPTANCAFEAKLPAGDAGARLDVWACAARGREEQLVFTHQFASPDDAARYREGAIMSDHVRLDDLRFQSGVFTALVTVKGGGEPKIDLTVRGEAVAEARLDAGGDGAFRMTATVPARIFGDGVATVSFTLADGAVIARYPVAAGSALLGDLAADVASLRVEVDQLKSALREALGGGVLRRDERSMIVAEALAQVDDLLEMRDRAERAHQRAEATDWEDDAGAWEIED